MSYYTRPINISDHSGVQEEDDGFNVLHQRRLGLFALQERQKRLCEREIGQIIGVELVVNRIQINTLWLAEVGGALDAGVQDDAVEVRVGFGDAAVCHQSSLLPNPHLESSD